MRKTWLVSLLVSLPVLAGCVVDEDDSEADEPGPPPPPYSSVRCMDGTLVDLRTAADGNGTRCNIRITGNPPGNTGPANELAIAVDPTDPLRLVAGGKDYALGADDYCGGTRVWSGYYWSSDGGYTWATENMPGHDEPASRQGESATNGYHCNSDPVVYWDDEGHAYYSGLAYAWEGTPVTGTLGNNLWMARSTDGGKTYERAYMVAQGTDESGILHDKQWFTFDPVSNNLYFTWSMFVTDPVPVSAGPADQFRFSDQIMFTRSGDGGRSWSPAVTLYETERVGPAERPSPELGKQFSMPAVDKDGNLYVVWNAAGSIWFTSSSNRGTTWSAARPILTGFTDVPSPLPPTDFRAHTLPVLVVDRSSNATAGTLYVVYGEYHAATKADVKMIQSRDRGASWSEPVLVHDDNGTATDQFMPWADVGPLGDLHVVFYDRRDDPANTWMHLYYAHWNGTAFGPNLRLTELAANGVFSKHQAGFDFMGDYIGVMEGANGWVHPIWVDTRHGRADAYTVAIVR